MKLFHLRTYLGRLSLKRLWIFYHTVCYLKKKKRYNQTNAALMRIIDPFQKNLTNPKHLNGSVKILNSPNSVF